jgi:hypothetical protein
MKLKPLLLLALAAVFTFALPRPARAIEVSFDFFYDSLSPYGEWLEVGDYGNCWKPTGVDEDWTPYSDGYWTYTDAGWTWVSYEDFGGIVYHYGRWVKVEDEGWVWVPDYEWGPAWVSWRKNNDYVGWAPLPAEAHWQRDHGFNAWVDTSYDIGPGDYNFCHVHDFGAPVLRPVIIRRSENIVIVSNTVNITNISYNTGAGCVFNGGLDYAYVNRSVRRPIPALKLVRNTNVTVVNNYIVNNNNTRVTNFNAVQRGNQLVVLAPTVVRSRANAPALVRPKIARVVPQQKVTRGWGSVPAEQRAAIKAQYAQQAKAEIPENAPARPVKPADLKVVPVKANPLAKVPVPVRPAGGNIVPKPVADDTTPAPVAKVPVAPVPLTKEPPITQRPGAGVKPFTPPGSDVAAPNDAAEKRNAAAAAALARKQAAAQQAAAVNQQRLQQAADRKAAAAAEAEARTQALRDKQDLIRQRVKPADVAPVEPTQIRRDPVPNPNAAAARQLQLQQQQQLQQDAVARRQAAQIQSQDAARARAAQAAQARQQAQGAAAARQQIPQNRPPTIQQQPRNVPPTTAVQPKKLPPGKDKRALTPEEAARLQNSQ